MQMYEDTGDAACDALKIVSYIQLAIDPNISDTNTAQHDVFELWGYILFISAMTGEHILA